ncbi:MAG: phosphoenolpyruvate--protein phosphotransferase [Lachnospiraceae bacterium]|nr:phosphoenolpyruvate--protein phosphotransferase [Candidatus Colinaster equi]
MKQYSGQVISEGTVLAKVFIGETITPNIEKMNVKDITNEETRLDEACLEVMSFLHKSIKRAKQEQIAEGIGIIDTHIALLSDDSKQSLPHRAKQLIHEETCNAEYALETVAGRMVDEFDAISKSGYLSARGEDILHIKNMLINTLLGVTLGCEIAEPAIIYSDRLSPEQLTSFDPKLIKGIVTAKGSALSHTAIIARNMNIPFLTGIKIDAGSVHPDMIGIIDSESNTFILDPDETTVHSYNIKMRENEEKALLIKEKAKELVGSCKVALYANIGRPCEVADAISNCAAGIGLFRSEFLFLDAKETVDEQSQYEAYKEVINAMDGKPVIVRTIDIGADKEAKCIKLPKESNPALGTRGIRISFANPDVFRTQLRALLRAAYCSNLKIMFPMISSLWEVKKVIEEVDYVAAMLKEEGIDYAKPPIGIMVETPAAVMILDDIAPYIDFVSIGTNDLTQYALGIDRTNENLSDYYDVRHKAVLELIRITVEKAHKHGISVGICGELGADIKLAKDFLKMGVDELSMPASKIPAMALALEGEVSVDSDILVPVDGYLIPMEEIPDAVFSKGLVGRCVGIYPENGIVTAPFDGVVTMIAKTKHAISIKSQNATEVLIHIGIDTVSMDGRGFEINVNEGDVVKAGSKLLTFDVDMIKDVGLSPIVIVVILPN